MKGNPPDGSSREYGRRPYLENSNESHMNRMRKVTDFLVYNVNVLPEQHSVFKKPYAEDDYLAMEYAYTPHFFHNPKWWDVPAIRAMDGGGTSYSWSWGWPEFDLTSGPTTSGLLADELIEGSSGGFGCIIICHGGYDCQDPVECNLAISAAMHPSVGTTWMGMSQNVDYILEVSDEFETFPIKISPAPVWNTDGLESYIYICFRDLTGQTCCVKQNISCKECDCEITDDLTFGTNNPLTIDQSETKSIFLHGGCGPYTWTVSGTGFTMGAAETDSYENTLIADGTACGVATIDVIDECGTDIELEVKGTTGTWGPSTYDYYVKDDDYPLWFRTTNTIRYGMAYDGSASETYCSDAGMDVFISYCGGSISGENPLAIYYYFGTLGGVMFGWNCCSIGCMKSNNRMFTLDGNDRVVFSWIGYSNWVC